MNRNVRLCSAMFAYVRITREKAEVGGRRSEDGCQKPEVGSQMSEAGDRMSEAWDLKGIGDEDEYEF